MENAEPPESQGELKESEQEEIKCTEFEELVRQALLDVSYQEFEQIVAQANAIACTPSPRYLDWEKKFLADPFHHAKESEDALAATDTTEPEP